MTRIIAIVVVIAAGVVAYMYTSAADVEVTREVDATSTEPADGEAAALTTALPGEESLEETEAVVVAEEPGDGDALVAEPAEEVVSEELGVGDDFAEEVLGDVPEADGEFGEEALVEEPEVAAGVEPEVVDDLGADATALPEEPTAEPELVEVPAGDDEAIIAVAPDGVEPDVVGEDAETELSEAPAVALDAETALSDALEPETDLAAAGDLAATPDEGAGPTGIGTTDLPNAPTNQGTEPPVAGSVDADEADVATVEVEEPETAMRVAEPSAVVLEPVEEELATEPQVEVPAETAPLLDPGPALRSDAVGAVVVPVTPADLDRLLAPETLDVQAVVAAIEASDLETAEKTQLTQALVTAQDSPDLLGPVLLRVRTALLGE